MAKIMTNSTMMIAWKDQKLNSISGIRNKDSISKFRIPEAGGVKEATHSKNLRNEKPQNPETVTSTGVSDTGSWRSQESRLFIIGVSKCRNEKRLKSRNRHINRSFGYRELEESRVKTLHHRSPEVPKCETPKIQKQAHQPEFQILGVGGVKSQDSSSQESRSAEMRNAENPEIGTSIGVSDTRSWRSQASR
jgi:hypothetical protein